MGSDSVPFQNRQLGVALGMAGGLAATIAAFVWPGPPHWSTSPADRLTLWMAASSLAAAWLLIAVAALARHRFFSPEDIDGGGLTLGSPRAKLLQTLVQNTLEQAVLAIIAYGAWLYLAAPASGAIVGVCVVYFSLGRLLFFLGYARGAPFRALGFALTFYPSVGLIVLTLPAAIRSLIAASHGG